MSLLLMPASLSPAMISRSTSAQDITSGEPTGLTLMPTTSPRSKKSRQAAIQSGAPVRSTIPLRIMERMGFEPIRSMMRRGMVDLTGAPDWIAAWRLLFERGDVVGIKVNPVGSPDAISCAEVLREIISGLNEAGVNNKDIVVYDRYRQQFLRAGFQNWLPDGVRQDWAVEDFDTIQLGMEGYDPEHYMEMALTQPGQ